MRIKRCFPTSPPDTDYQMKIMQDNNQNIKEYCTGVKGIIFDYGGTIDSRGDHWSEVILRGWRKVLGEDIDYQLFRDAYVEGERAMARERIIMPDDDFRATLLKKVLVELKYYFSRSGEPGRQEDLNNDGVSGLEGKGVAEKIAVDTVGIAGKIADACDYMARESVNAAKGVLGDLKKRYPMVLVSNFYGNVESVLAGYDVARFFDAVVESAVVGVRKPDPAIFALGVEALGMRPDEVVVIGDTYKKDILPALHLGCRAIWIKGKGWTPEDDAQEYSYIIHNLEELRDCLL